ncbi:universal stress protein [Agrilactobacillus fermenti]|uniref:universal stress protein n=1 Tax=Agrilactobacillus fermenti TaxID=2586909 RepID=UPI001E3E99AD|nr:universal stress protein [Agrilactobacillus fermenti]MCD2255572.1 universal stress protein [Agrilactobacillus fermenti]
MLQEYNNILVPVDGSKEAELALQKAVQVAKLNKAHVDILNVLDTKQFIGGYGGMLSGDAIYQISEDAQDYLSNLADEIRSKNDLSEDDLSIHVRFGNPKTVISVDFPRDHKNDLIMIGATGLNAVERVLVGSVTEYVNQHALCDVLIVKTDIDNKTPKK